MFLFSDRYLSRFRFVSENNKKTYSKPCIKFKYLFPMLKKGSNFDQNRSEFVIFLVCSKVERLPDYFEIRLKKKLKPAIKKGEKRLFKRVQF